MAPNPLSLIPST